MRPALLLLLLAAGCEQLVTEAPNPGDLFDASIDGLTAEERAAFAAGDAEFGRAFAPAEGLGPIFNNVSCASCHSGDGRGLPENILVRIALGASRAEELGGPQIQDKVIPGAVAETLPAGVDVSRRLPPPVFGVGLIEAIPEAVILSHADPDDADGDGISGRPNWVVAAEFVPVDEPGGGPGLHVGRFSRKAQVSSLVQQTVEAYHQDMGITSDFLSEENVNPLASAATRAADHVADPELPAHTVRAVVDYSRMLAPPAPGNLTPQRARGEELFATIACASCHVPSLSTGPSPIGALENRRADLYSDLLLHDMGEELADHRSDGDATGTEWRTTPLWGLRIARDFLNGSLFLLHDGRAGTVEEAIHFHGGEAAAARDAFLALPIDDRHALLDFVESR